MKKLFTFIFILLGVALCHAQQIFSFHVKEFNTEAIHFITINTSDFTISAVDTNGKQLYSYKFYAHQKNEKGHIGFAFQQGQKPKFSESDDRFLIVSKNMVVNTMEKPDVEFLYTPVDYTLFKETFIRLEIELNKLVYHQVFKVNGVEFNMVRIKGGTFRMGSDSEQARPDEAPVHFVTLNDYYISQTEVTQRLWTAVMGSNPSKFQQENNPVEQVSWNDCQIFIDKLNALTGQRFRLPTEAEWEYAAKGGTRTEGRIYAGADEPTTVAWCNANANHTTHPVSQLTQNETKLYDMSGNVWEWCSDWSADYPDANLINPKGAAKGSHRIIRGGAYNDNSRELRTTARNRVKPNEKYSLLGLRLAL